MLWAISFIALWSVVKMVIRHDRQRSADPPTPLQLPVAQPSGSHRGRRPRPYKLLAQAQEGEYITVSGQLRSSAHTLVAPLSGLTCVAYAATARTVGHAAPSVDLREMKIAPLVVAIGESAVVLDGECMVNLRLAPVSPRDADRERAFLERRQLQHFLPSTEFSEGVLSVGDRVWVSGVLVYEHDRGEHGYREQPIRIRLESRPDLPLSIGRARRGGDG